MSASTKNSLQDLILNLQKYWAEQGCVILQPYDMEMGRGHFIQRQCALGPEEWNAAYVQPSRRPPMADMAKTQIAFNIIISFRSS